LLRVVSSLDASDLSAQLTAAARLRRLLSADDPPIKEAVGRGAVPRLVELLRRDSSPRLQLEAAWALTNIASGAPEHVRAVVDGGALTPLCHLLRASDSAVREQAAWALGNIAGDGAKMRDKVLAAGALEPLVRTLRDAGAAALAAGKEGAAEAESDRLALATSDPDGGAAGTPGSLPMAALRTCVWALSNLVRGKPAPQLKAVASALPVLAELTNVDDEEVLTDVCWALSYLGERAEGVDAVIETGVCSRLAGLLSASSASVQKSALHAVGNIVAGSQSQAQAALDGGALPLLTKLLSSRDAEVQRLAAWAISNVTAGSSDQIEAMIDLAAVPPLLALLRSPSRAVRKEAAFALVNVTTSPWPQHTQRLVEQGVIAPLCELLSPTEPADIVTVTLEGLQNIMKVGEAVDDSSGLPVVAGSVRPGPAICTIVGAVVAANGKARMEALLEHHRAGPIHAIASVLLHSYIQAFEGLSLNGQQQLPTAASVLALAAPLLSPQGVKLSAMGNPVDTGTSAKGRRNKGRASSGSGDDALPIEPAVLALPAGASSGKGKSASGQAASKATAQAGALRAAKGVSAAVATEAPPSSSAASAPEKTPPALTNGQRVEFMVTIKNFTARRNRGHPAGQYSEIFDGKKAGRWRLLSYTHGTVAGKDGEWLSLYVSSADVDELACKYRWSRTVDYSITLVHPSANGPSGKKNRAGGEGKGDDATAANASLSVTRRHTSVVFRGVHNDYEWGCRDFLPSDQVVDQGFLLHDSLLVRVEVELREDGPGQPLSVLTPLELKAHLAWAAENGLPRACLACLTTFAANNGASTEAKGVKTSDHGALTTHLATSANGLITSTCSEEWGTPLHLACIGWRPGNAHVVSLLLDCGAPVDALNKHGETPLVLAAREGGQTAVVDVLLARSGNPCLCSKGGWSPMSAAASRGRDDVVRLLAQRGAPLEEVWPPLSALLEAAKAGHALTALTLLESGADPEVQDEKGNTALWILLEKNMTEAALTMVQRHHASVAQCSRERSKVQRAKLLLKHAQRRGKSLGSGKGGGSGDSTHEQGGQDELDDRLLEGDLDDGLDVALDAEAAALDLVKELEEEENNKASKSSKNRKKKEKLKQKKQEKQSEVDSKKKDLESEKQQREAARKRDDDEKRNRERREQEESERIRRESAKLEWQRAREEERQRADADLVNEMREIERQNARDGGSGSASNGSSSSNSGNSAASSAEPAMSSARSKKRRNAGTGEEANNGKNNGARNVMQPAVAATAKPTAAAKPAPVQQQEQTQQSKQPQQQQQSQQQQQQQQQLTQRKAQPAKHSAVAPSKPEAATSGSKSSPWGAPVPPTSQGSSSAPSSALSSLTSPFHMPAQPSPAAAAVQDSKLLGMGHFGGERLVQPSSGPFGAPLSSNDTLNDSISSSGWDRPPPVSHDPPVSLKAPEASQPLPNPSSGASSLAVPLAAPEALSQLGQLGSLLSRRLDTTRLNQIVPVLTSRSLDYGSFLMMSEAEIMALGLPRDTAAALLDVQEEEVLSGVGGMGFMDSLDDDEGGGSSSRGMELNGMDFLLGDDDEVPPPQPSVEALQPLAPPASSSPSLAAMAPPGSDLTAAAADGGSLPESPALAVMRYEAVRGMMAQMKDIEDRLAAAAHAEAGRAAAASERKRAEDADQDFRGFVFVCSSDTAAEALETGLLGLPGSHCDDLADAIEDQTPIFLFNFSDGTLHGAWVADGRPGMNLNPAAFSSPNRNSSRFPAQLRVKVADPALYPHIALQLDNENLSFTSKLAGHWSWFGVPGPISKAHTRAILEKMHDRVTEASKLDARSAPLAPPATPPLRSSNAGRNEGCSLAAALVSDCVLREGRSRLGSDQSSLLPSPMDPLLSSTARPEEVARVARAELLRNVIAKAGLSSLCRDLSEKLDNAAQQAARCWVNARDRVNKFAREEAELQPHTPVAEEAFRVASVAGPGVSDAVGVVEVCWNPSPALQAASHAAQTEDPGAKPWSAAASGAPSAEASLMRALPPQYSTFVSMQTFRSLSQVYTERGHAPHLFVPRLFELALLHETLAACTTPSGGGFGAFELALPESLLNEAQMHFRATQVFTAALFARPGGHLLLGTAMPLQADGCWGSSGAFPDAQLDTGSFLLHLPMCWTHDATAPLNPPPDSPLRHFQRPLVRGFATAASSGQPLSFLLVASLPRREDGAPKSTSPDEAASLTVDPSLRPFLRIARVVPRAQASYECRRLVSVASGPSSNTEVAALALAVESVCHHHSDQMSGWADDGCDAMFCVLQNDAGSRAWPITDDSITALTRALAEAACATEGGRGAGSGLGSAFDAPHSAMGFGDIGEDFGSELQGKAGGVSWARVAAGKK
jgi:hypothetical protein